MRFSTIFGAAFSLSALLVGAVASESSTDSAPPAVYADAEWRVENPLLQVVNGQKNTLVVTIENKSGQNVTLSNISAGLSHPITGKVHKNLTVAQFGIPLVDEVKMQLPYSFYSEHKPGDYRLNVWIEHSIEGKKHRADAYQMDVTVIEPPFSVFDIKLILTYLIVAALLGGAGYLAYDAYFPQPKAKKAKKQEVSAPVTVTATGAGGYQEEWIPEHHLKKTKSKKTAGLAATSGDELSGR
ncbi:hypothetical protein BKA70DRAFT_1277305 [Coprinopsis sp. MPI-PUGE-AT-0042]|nr:hypothetical protein BKA70DRAFT_1277305 [Coprinopsis sp. MPI-PUGE-AT-0042]